MVQAILPEFVTYPQLLHALDALREIRCGVGRQRLGINATVAPQFGKWHARVEATTLVGILSGVTA